MNQALDARVPVRFASADRAGRDEALLIEGDEPAPVGHAVARFRLAPGRVGHALGCACCIPRGPVAEALGGLFLARSRGEVAWFRSVAVVATPAGEAAVREALSADQVSAGRFRLVEQPQAD